MKRLGLGYLKRLSATGSYVINCLPFLFALRLSISERAEGNGEGERNVL